jgi:hypothetical protein
MKVALVAFHYPHPEHRDEMISRVHRAANVMAAAPGCLALAVLFGTVANGLPVPARSPFTGSFCMRPWVGTLRLSGRGARSTF